jgi:hypothetical protein
MDWGSMASFAIAIALLMTGVKKTQELGVSGASALGKAMSTATRVAKVASGVAAVGWGAGKVVQGGKWAAKGVAMKMPVVGGDSWKRRGRSIKARVSERWADYQSERETKLAKNLKDREKNKAEVARDLPGVIEARKKAQEELKKAQKELKNEEKKGLGIPERAALNRKITEAQGKVKETQEKEKDLKSKAPGTFWASVALTERQKEKQVKNLDNAAKSADEERDETLGLGGTEIGKRSGRRMMKKKLASEQAEQDKITGLAGAEAEELKKLGRFDEADAVLENAQAKVNKMESEKFANLSLDTLKLRMSEAVKNRKKALEKYESTQSDEEKKQALADANKSSKDVMRLLGIGATQGSSSKQALADIALNAAGMKNRSLGGSAKQLATIATGVNAEKDGGKTTQDIYLKFKGIDEKSWATIIADTKRKGEELQEKTGDASLAAAITSGVQESKDGKFSKVVSDIGSNHGNKKFDGSDQTGQDYLATDKERLKYFKESAKLRMSEPLTVESLVSEQISKDKDGNITENVKFDEDKTAITARILSESSPAMIGKIINNTFVKSLLPLLKLEGDQVKIVAKMLNELKEGRKDDKNWGENFDKAFGEDIVDILEKKGGYERTSPSTKKDKGPLGDGEDPGDEPKK